MKLENVIINTDDENDLNADNVIEKIRDKLKKGNNKIYKQWEETDFDINHSFELTEHKKDKTTYKRTLLALAISEKCPNVMLALVEKGVDITMSEENVINGVLLNSQEREEIIEDPETEVTVIDGKIRITKCVPVEDGVDYLIYEYSGDEQLNWAASYGRFDLFKAVYESGIDKTDYTNGTTPTTPLHWAVQHGNMEIIEYILEKTDAYLNVLDERGWTPLLYAAEFDDFEVLKYLIERGADMYEVDNNSWNALSHAVGVGALDIVKYLIEEKGMDFEQVDEYGRTLMHLATILCRKNVLNYLIKTKNADFNKTDNFKETILHYGVGTGNLEFIKYLINEIGVDYQKLNVVGHSVLDSAIHKGFSHVVEYLVETLGINFGFAVHTACKEGKLEILRYLIDEQNFEFDVKKNGRTPLDVAVERGHFDIVKYLVGEKNVIGKGDLDITEYLMEDTDPSDIDGDGLIDLLAGNFEDSMPMLIAATHGHSEIFAYLVRHGAGSEEETNGGTSE